MVCVCLFSRVLVLSQKLFSGDGVLPGGTHPRSVLGAGRALIFPAALCSLSDFGFLSSVGRYYKFPLNA